MASPVMAAEEIFRLAGWSTPSLASAGSGQGQLFSIQSPSPLPPFFGEPPYPTLPYPMPS